MFIQICLGHTHRTQQVSCRMLSQILKSAQHACKLSAACYHGFEEEKILHPSHNALVPTEFFIFFKQVVMLSNTDKT